MSEPEVTPSESTPAPDAEASGEVAPNAESTEAVVASGEAPAEVPAGDDASTEGEAHDEAEGAEAGDESTEASADGAEGAEAGDESTEASADGAPADPTKKKKRRRRKKKKPGTEGAEAGGHDTPRPPRASRPASERAPFHVGEEVFGKVTAVLDTAIMVDLSGKALAIFDRTEMEADDLVPSVGDRFVARIHNDGARGGLVVLTRKPLREEEIKPAIEQAEKEGTVIQGLVTGVIKGGIEVDILGLRAFAPASGMDLHPQNANFAILLGQRMDFKVIQYKAGGRDVVVTRRPMLEAEAHERRKQALTLLQEEQVMNGVVRTVVEWGAFIALPEAENLEGLVHISEASHDARAKITDLFKPGDHVQVKILKIDEKGKIWLSTKALQEDPWGEAKQKYAQGSRHTGKVMRLMDFGVFVELEPGVEGLIHVSDLAFNRIEHPKEVVKDGETMDVIVHHFDPRTKKIGLHPAPPADRAEEAQRVQRNSMLKVEIVKHEASGLIVRILGATGRAARGFIPAGQTGTPRGTDLRRTFKQGSVIEAKVIDVDPRRGEPKLSIKAMKEDEERKAHRDYRQALQREGGFGTLGDLLAAKLKGASGSSNE